MAAITSLSNPRVKQLVRLRTRRERDRTGTFLIEGYRELAKAAQAMVQMREVYYCPALYLGTNEPELLARFTERGAAAIELGADAFRKVAYRDRPEGLLAVGEQFSTGLGQLDRSAALVLVAESIEKPGNLGTMVRTADAAGADAVVVCDPTTDVFNPNAVRASIGSIFTIPVLTAETDETIAGLAARDIPSVATSPDATRAHWTADLRGPVAIVIGAEQVGLSSTWLGAANDVVGIPMAGAADSLNAAMAAGVMLFEAVRQRSQVPPG